MSNEHRRDAVATAARATATVSAPEGMVLLRSYLSTHHRWAGRYFAERAQDLERRILADPSSGNPLAQFDLKHRSVVIASVFASVAFVEAAVNEILQDAIDEHMSYLHPIPAESRSLLTDFWRSTQEKNFSIVDKLQLMLTLCRKPQLSAGAAPLQDAKKAIELRNALMHFKPETLGGGQQHKFAKSLRSRFTENPLMASSGNPYFPDKCLGSPCCFWVADTCDALAVEFFSRLGIQANYRAASFCEPSGAGPA